MTDLSSLQSMKNRVAVITGGAGKLGLEFAETLAELGATVVLIDKNSEALNLAADRLRHKLRAAVHTYPCDLENEKNRIETVRAIEEQHPQISCLINNAAFVGETNLEGWSTSFEEQSMTTWRRALEVNTLSAFHLAQLLKPALLTGSGPNIINVSSIYAGYGPDWRLYQNEDMGNPAAYGVSKAGLEQLTRWLATTLAPHIRVNAISPGGIQRGQTDTFIKKYSNKVPLARMAKEDDFKGVAAFLATDMSAYVTGQVLAVNGGWGIW